MELIGKAKVHGKRTGFCVVLNAEVAVPAKLRLWWTQKQEIPLMVVAECMGAYQQGQKLRKIKDKSRGGSTTWDACLLSEKEIISSLLRTCVI